MIHVIISKTVISTIPLTFAAKYCLWYWRNDWRKRNTSLAAFLMKTSVKRCKVSIEVEYTNWFLWNRYRFDTFIFEHYMITCLPEKRYFRQIIDVYGISVVKKKINTSKWYYLFALNYFSVLSIDNDAVSHNYLIM